MFGRRSTRTGSPHPGPDRPPVPARAEAEPPEDDGTRRSAAVSGTTHLEQTLSTLVAYASGGAVPSHVVINPLLEVWEAAHEIAAEVSVPVEVLLTSAVQRPSLQPDELIGCIEEVWALAVQQSVLSELVHG